MQKLRTVAVALVATIVVSAGADAQGVRNFDNSWFWGVKSGSTRSRCLAGQYVT